MPKLPFFNGDFYTVDDPGSESCQLINVFGEVIDSGSGKSVGRLIGTPGTQLWATVGTGPIRALWTGEGRMFTVSGSQLWEMFADGEGDLLGTVGDDADHTPAYIFPTGNELMIVSAGYVWRQWNETAGTLVIHHVDKIKLIAAEYTDLAIAVVAFLYDLEISETDATKVTSRKRPFKDPDDVGFELHIIEGIDFAGGTTLGILAVTDGWATLTGIAGVAGTTGGVANLVDTLQTDKVSSPTLPFIPSDVGQKLVIDPVSPIGFGGGGTYTIMEVSAEGIAKLSTGAGVAGATGGIAVQYPGESIETDANAYIKAGTGAWLDGYGIVSPPNSKVFLISGINDLSRWLALDKGTKEGFPDNILALIADHEELIIFGDNESGEVWRNTGAANFPFERSMGAFMHFGLAAQFSVTRLGLNGIAWLGWSEGRGSPQAYYAAGFQPQRISTPMLERLWDAYPNVRDARAFGYIEDGHHFWVITFPSADITWCYDFTASQQMGKPMWHARATGNGPLGPLGSGPTDPEHAWHRIRANCHTYGFFAHNEHHPSATWTRHLTHFVGDYQTGAIYAQGLYLFTDGETPIRRAIQTIHLANENKRTVWDLFQLECRVGDGGEDIEWTLDYSRDRGHTYINPRTRSAAGTGPTHQRLRWWRCGQSYDQVWRLTTESPAKVSITSAWFEATECAH